MNRVENHVIATLSRKPVAKPSRHRCEVRERLEEAFHAYARKDGVLQAQCWAAHRAHNAPVAFIDTAHAERQAVFGPASTPIEPTERTLRLNGGCAVSAILSLPTPLTPPECDLRGLPFIPLDGDRLIESDLFFLSTGDEFKAAVTLWWASWKQVPAASLPDNERILAGLAKLDAKKWAKVREVALRGWIKCSDGRLYHSVVAEKALEAWEDRQHHQDTKAGERERKKREREDRRQMFESLRQRGVHMAWNSTTSELRAKLAEPLLITDQSRGQVADGHAHVTTIEGTGTGTEEVGSEAKASGAERPTDDLDKLTWDTSVLLLMDRGRMTEKSARSFFGRLLSKNALIARDLLASVHSATVAGTPDPQGYLERAAAGIASRRAPIIPKRVGFV